MKFCQAVFIRYKIGWKLLNHYIHIWVGIEKDRSTIYRIKHVVMVHLSLTFCILWQGRKEDRWIAAEPLGRQQKKIGEQRMVQKGQ